MIAEEVIKSDVPNSIPPAVYPKLAQFWRHAVAELLLVLSISQGKTRPLVASLQSSAPTDQFCQEIARAHVR